MDKRRTYFDFLRGIAIMMVVGIHTYSQPTYVGGFDISLLCRQVLNCAVPIFFAISGFFCFQKHLSDKSVYAKFLAHQVSKVYIPALLWSFPLLVWAIYKGASPVAEISKMIVCGYSIYYFIAVTIQFYILLPLFQRLQITKWGG